MNGIDFDAVKLTFDSVKGIGLDGVLLKEYDEFGILMYTMWHSDKDGLYLKEV